MPSTTKPGVQKPHWNAKCSMNASCSTESVPSALSRPSTVVTSTPAACTARVRQDRADSPSISTVQVPHQPWWQAV